MDSAANNANLASSRSVPPRLQSVPNACSMAVYSATTLLVVDSVIQTITWFPEIPKTRPPAVLYAPTIPSWLPCSAAKLDIGFDFDIRGMFRTGYRARLWGLSKGMLAYVWWEPGIMYVD